MPLWTIYHPQDAYSATDKQAFAAAITDLYAQYGLPRFYVSVLFHGLPKDAFFIGGEPTDDFVRIWIDQIARRVPPGQEDGWMAEIDAVLGPFVGARGLRWEIHVDETPFDLWRIQGLKPPAPDSETEQLWARQNRVSAY